MFSPFLSQKWKSNRNIITRKHTRDKENNEQHIDMYISIIWFWIHKISNEKTSKSTKVHIRRNKITKHPIVMKQNSKRVSIIWSRENIRKWKQDSAMLKYMHEKS